MWFYDFNNIIFVQDAKNIRYSNELLFKNLMSLYSVDATRWPAGILDYISIVDGLHHGSRGGKRQA